MTPHPRCLLRRTAARAPTAQSTADGEFPRHRQRREIEPDLAKLRGDLDAHREELEWLVRDEGAWRGHPADLISLKLLGRTQDLLQRFLQLRRPSEGTASADADARTEEADHGP